MNDRGQLARVSSVFTLLESWCLNSSLWTWLKECCSLGLLPGSWGWVYTAGLIYRHAVGCALRKGDYQVLASLEWLIGDFPWMNGSGFYFIRNVYWELRGGLSGNSTFSVNMRDQIRIPKTLVKPDVVLRWEETRDSQMPCGQLTWNTQWYTGDSQTRWKLRTNTYTHTHTLTHCDVCTHTYPFYWNTSTFFSLR